MGGRGRQRGERLRRLFPPALRPRPQDAATRSSSIAPAQLLILVGGRQRRNTRAHLGAVRVENKDWMAHNGEQARVVEDSPWCGIFPSHHGSAPYYVPLVPPPCIGGWLDPREFSRVACPRAPDLASPAALLRRCLDELSSDPVVARFRKV